MSQIKNEWQGDLRAHNPQTEESMPCRWPSSRLALCLASGVLLLLGACSSLGVRTGQGEASPAAVAQTPSGRAAHPPKAKAKPHDASPRSDAPSGDTAAAQPGAEENAAAAPPGGQTEVEIALGSSVPGRVSGMPDDSRVNHPKASEIVLFALGLLDTGYKFGGKNPEAGLDCSGLISYVYGQVMGWKLAASAKEIARQAKPLALADLHPGDLVFFNTRGGPFTHAGIYVGQGKFVHAPSRHGRVRIDRLDNNYFKRRYTTARTFFPGDGMVAYTPITAPARR